MASSPQIRAANARAALEALPPGELRDRKVRAAEASAVARRQSRELAIEVRIQPAHLLTPEQVIAWRSLWRTLLDPTEFAGHENAGRDQRPASDAEECGDTSTDDPASR